MIIYGTGELKGPVSPAGHTCPCCQMQAVRTYTFTPYVHLYWIPVFPTGKRVAAGCDNCHTVYMRKSEMPTSLRSQIDNKSHEQPISYWSFSGLAIATAAFLYFTTLG